MTECRWIEACLDDVFSDDPDSRKRVRRHLAECAVCREELEGHAEVARLIRAHFDDRSRRAAEAGRPALTPVRLAAAMGALMLAAFGLWVGAGAPDRESPGSVPFTASTGSRPSSGSFPAAPLDDPLRAKPATGPEAPVDAAAGVPDAPPPGFQLSDAAGYFYSLEDFSGSVFLLAVFDDSGRSAAEFQRLYATYRSEPRLRMAAVTMNGELPRGGFPTWKSVGTSLLGAGPGEFALLGPDGRVRARGPLEDAAVREAIAALLAE